MTVSTMKKKAIEQLRMAAYNAKNEWMQGDYEYAEGLARDLDAYEDAFTTVLGLLTNEEAQEARADGYDAAVKLNKKYE
jgi:hypothetical protein